MRGGDGIAEIPCVLLTDNHPPEPIFDVQFAKHEVFAWVGVVTVRQSCKDLFEDVSQLGHSLCWGKGCGGVVDRRMWVVCGPELE